MSSKSSKASHLSKNQKMTEDRSMWETSLIKRFRREDKPDHVRLFRNGILCYDSDYLPDFKYNFEK